MAVSSSLVRLLAVPLPAETPNAPVVRCAPGIISMRLEPSDWMLEDIELCAPWPTETSAMTEAMPMTMSRMVKPERTLLAESAVYVSWRVSLMVMFGVAARSEEHTSELQSQSN